MMISVFIAFLPALFMWEFTAIKVNLRLPTLLRKRLFKIGGRFALIAIILEFVAHIVPLAGLPPLSHAFVAALFTAAIPEKLVKFVNRRRSGTPAKFNATN